MIEKSDQPLVGETLKVRREGRWKSVGGLLEDLFKKGSLVTPEELIEARSAIEKIEQGDWNPNDEYLAGIVSLYANEIEVSITDILSNPTTTRQQNHELQQFDSLAGVE